MTTKPIQEFIAQSEENLQIANAVTEALPSVRHNMAMKFLARLDARVKERFPGWKSACENDKTYFGDQWASYYFLKPLWVGHYEVALQFGEYGKEIVFGVLRDYDSIGDRPFCDELISAVKRVNPLAKPQKWWWEARIPMESPAANWRRPDVLWRMHTDGKFLEDVAEQLLELAQISEATVDHLVQKYRK